MQSDSSSSDENGRAIFVDTQEAASGSGPIIQPPPPDTPPPPDAALPADASGVPLGEGANPLNSTDQHLKDLEAPCSDSPAVPPIPLENDPSQVPLSAEPPPVEESTSFDTSEDSGIRGTTRRRRHWRRLFPFETKPGASSPSPHAMQTTGLTIRTYDYSAVDYSLKTPVLVRQWNSVDHLLVDGKRKRHADGRLMAPFGRPKKKSSLGAIAERSRSPQVDKPPAKPATPTHVDAPDAPEGGVRWIRIQGSDRTQFQQLAQRYGMHPLAIADVSRVKQLPKVTRLNHQVVVVCYPMYLVRKDPKQSNTMSSDDSEASQLDPDVEFRSQQLSIVLVDANTILTFEEAEGMDIPTALPLNQSYSDGGALNQSNSGLDTSRPEMARAGSDHSVENHDMYESGIWRPVLSALMSRLDRTVREQDASFLLYTILESVTENYFPVTSYWSVMLQGLEEKMLVAPTRDMALKVSDIHHELKLLQKILWIMTDISISLTKDPLMSRSSKDYITVVTDHLKLNVEVCKTYIETCNAIGTQFSAYQNDKMNDSVKILTCFTTIFVPMSFLAGVYGMNFDNLPELHYENAYPIFWCVCLTQTILQILFFRRLGWI